MNGPEPKSMARSRFFGQPVQAEVNGNLCPVAIYYSSANLTSLLEARPKIPPGDSPPSTLVFA